MTTIPPLRSDVFGYAPYGLEHDACALIVNVRKRGEGTFGTLKRALGSLAHMGHRTGFVEGEGDGAGIQTDIPRQIWARILSQNRLRSSLATDPRFWVGHCFIPADVSISEVEDQLSAYLNEAGLNPLMQQPGRVNLGTLGRQGQYKAPRFWQIAGCAVDFRNSQEVEQRLFQVMVAMERDLPLHFASLSTQSVVYKARGAVEVLPRYYPDLQDRSYTTAISLCHARYSTNTVSSFERVQPFPLLGHNGEFNTISRFRQEAQQIGAILNPGNSDSQDVDRALHSLCMDYGLDLIEAMELILPPTPHELEHFPPALRAVYSKMRQAFGPYAQGPSAVVARLGDLVVCSVDALGLRPLWFIETEKEYIFSSERGVIPFDNMVREPRALAPGEKVALRVQRGQSIDILEHDAIRHHIMNWSFQREMPRLAERYWAGLDFARPENSPRAGNGSSGLMEFAPIASPVALESSSPAVSTPLPAPIALPWASTDAPVRDLDTATFAATGWNREHMQEIGSLVELSKDLVGSLGHDGPLAVLSKNRVNMADFYKETVAVVTNPAIDREREAEAFSTRTLVGARPAVNKAPASENLLLTLETPILPGGHPSLGGAALGRAIAEALGTLSLEELLQHFEGRWAALTLGIFPDENVQTALERLAAEAIDAVRMGVQCILLDDHDTLLHGLGWLDPLLAVAHVDQQLRDAQAQDNLRRRAGLVLRSASVRNLHDIAMIYGFGADAVNPYAMLGVAIGAGTNKASLQASDEQSLLVAQKQVIRLLSQGLEKVISTIGCHELRAYGRVGSAIGLAPSLAQIMQAPNYFGSEDAGLTWERLNAEAAERSAELRGETKVSLARVDRFYPKFWKKAEAVAHGEMTLEAFVSEYQRLSQEVPVALRHVLGFRENPASQVRPEDVDIRIGDHDYPFLISAMSYGSQGELAYKAYAQAAAELNMLCINGEGGELPEIMHLYKRNRGQQVASGRFGVNAEFLNSAVVLEIKIGQGAKPGEGGMLPASKVNEKVAQARHTEAYVSLISPSNNHDIYSIEDLAQIIEELKTVNPTARISVKVPVVPGIGVIAVGVAKAGADIINMTGYDGATGAARRHALQYVGLPAEIGVTQAHRALLEAGLRHKVELWCDGGMKTGSDAVKMMLLGANRVGFATMAMVAVGCTICRKCHEGTCHVGITTHIQTVEEARAKGLKSFEPRDYDQAVVGMVRIFQMIGQEMEQIVARLGFTDLQSLVGRADLLAQVECQDMVDLSPMLYSAPRPTRIDLEPGIGRRLTRPRNTLTNMITDIVLGAVRDGESEVTYQDEVMAYDRALGSHLAGELIRQRDCYEAIDALHLHFGPSAVAGNGFAAFAVEKMDFFIEGGAQDGVGKSMSGGMVSIMKGVNHTGLRLDGNVGKSFAYGAQGGILIVQGNADSRACIRLSGAKVVFGGEITQRIDDSAGVSGKNANLKGFACEYMTAGQVLIMGDPGPYMCAGMTGGVVYQHLSPELGFDLDALHRRLALGAKVSVHPLESQDIDNIQALLGHYISALERSAQYSVADRTRALSQGSVLQRRFVKIVPLQA